MLQLFAIDFLLIFLGEFSPFGCRNGYKRLGCIAEPLVVEESVSLSIVSHHVSGICPVYEAGKDAVVKINVTLPKD